MKDMDLMNQVNKIIQGLPVLLKEDQSGVLSEAEINFTPFIVNDRSKSEIHWLFRPEETGGCGAALVRYHPGGESPLHEHTGFEFAYVLDGEMITNQGKVKKNDLMLLPPGSRHRSRSETGCLALIVWEKPPVTIE
ncbi:cupin domain-containing protein [Marininema halotolerans]|uniref:ChrR Cupin-like domain-containing protein n=1 Tax=Marininema halotolerans TaxID=1155944 RepID=A0A1I6R382_9BACL|nr:cupin domain-containing protein [Marininema halotolerans]SFS59172.1 ChrR Cupin-like domain-containing protein [Marininema halotolerans]